MKRIFISFFATAMLLSSFSLTVSARGHHNDYNNAASVSTSNAQATSLCIAKDCNIASHHYHDDVLHSGHYLEDGHNHKNIDYNYTCGIDGNHSHGERSCYYNNYNSSSSSYRGGSRCH